MLIENDLHLDLIDSDFRELETLPEAISRAQEHLLNLQNPQGYWVGYLEADASVTAGYIPLMYFMQVRVEPDRVQKIVNSVVARQNSDGSWSAYHGGDGDLNVSIQVYFGLKLAGVEAGLASMQLAAEFIRSKGGVSQASVFTKIWLSLFGLYAWRDTPSVPPEIILLPNWFYFNIYEFASWSRETIMALAVVTSTRPICSVPPEAGISELYVEPQAERASQTTRNGSASKWKGFFRLLDRFFKLYDRSPFKPGRQTALHKVEQWIVNHQESDGSWGGSCCRGSTRCLP